MASLSSPVVVPFPGLFPAPPGVQPNFINPEKHTGGVVPLSCIFVSLSTIFLVLRLYTKLRIVKVLGWDDLVITTAWLCTLIATGLVLRSYAYGAGIHIWNVRIDEFPMYVKLNTIATIFGSPANGLPKIAILLYYLRINPARWFRYSTITALVINTLWILIYMCVIGLSCQPVKKVYDITVPGKCLNLVPWYTSASIGNPILDLVVIVIPIPMVVHLHANLRTKLVLATIFFVSSCTIVISLLRIPATFILLDSIDVTRTFTRGINLAIVEYNLSVVCGSALVLRPFCRQYLPWLFGASRPSDRADASPGRKLNGSSDPKSRKINTIGGSSPNPNRKRGWWDGLGDTQLTNEDDGEDLENLRGIELNRSEGSAVGTMDNKHWTSERETAANEGSTAGSEIWSDFQSTKINGTTAGIRR